VDAMPLTGVGKIFKPALRRRETEDALKSALVAAGVEDATVSIIEDSSRGISLHVELPDPALEALATSALGRFPFAFSVSVAAKPQNNPDSPEASEVPGRPR
jgi:fatty-acyl-CoA synthase